MARSCSGQIDELLPGYALGALDEGERALVEEHLKECALCRRVLVEYRGVADELLYAVPQVIAPGHLQEDLRRRLPSAGKPALRPTAPEAVSWGHSQARGWAYALAAAMLLLLLSNLYWWRATGALVSQQARLQQQVQAQQLAMEILASGGRTAVLHGDGAAPQVLALLTWAPDQTQAVLQVSGLPVAPSGKAYQLWLIRDGQRDSGGLFAADPRGQGTLVVQAPQPLQRYQAVGVTLEPAGGSAAPTSPRLFGGSL
jgi:anti-sigma-K factor RskA